MADMMLAFVGENGREIVGGYGLGYEFVADLRPDLIDGVFDDDDAPTEPGYHVWEGSGTFHGGPDDLKLSYAGTWRRATAIDVAMLDKPEAWN